MSQPLVTVLMAVLNGEKWLPTAVADILRQTMSDFELLVVNDGSTDRTQELLAGFGDTRIRVERLEHVGLAPALNRGIELASGRYIARMDVDDRSAPERLAKQLSAAERHGDAVAVGCTFEVLDGTGVRRSVIAPPTHDADIRRRLLVRNPFAAGSVMFQAQALRDAGGYRELYTSAEDYELLIRMAKMGKLTSAPEPLYGWRVHPGNMSLRMRNREIETVGRLHDDLWGEMPAPRRSRELSARLGQYCTEIPQTGEVVASQVLQTEILICRSMLRRRRWRDGVRQLVTLSAVLPRRPKLFLHGLPRRISQTLSQRLRARRAVA
jgi:glycosyltransferase involved in cell wall biosynthesis